MHQSMLGIKSLSYSKVNVKHSRGAEITGWMDDRTALGILMKEFSHTLDSDMALSSNSKSG